MAEKKWTYRLIIGFLTLILIGIIISLVLYMKPQTSKMVVTEVTSEVKKEQSSEGNGLLVNIDELPINDDDAGNSSDTDQTTTDNHFSNVTNASKKIINSIDDEISNLQRQYTIDILPGMPDKNGDVFVAINKNYTNLDKLSALKCTFNVETKKFSNCQYLYNSDITLDTPPTLGTKGDLKIKQVAEDFNSIKTLMRDLNME